jgi:putative membrane protein
VNFLTAKRELKVLVLAAVVMAAVCIAACSRERSVEAARDDRTPIVSPAAQDFMMKAAEGDLSGIEMARLALQKSSNKDVRDYANMIQSDHTSALEDLTDLMKDKNVSQPGSVPPDVKKDIDRMNGLIGPEFDREFINRMVEDHKKTIEMFQERAAVVQDRDVKKYAEDLLPKLEMHLEKAQRLQSKLFSMPPR